MDEYAPIALIFAAALWHMSKDFIGNVSPGRFPVPESCIPLCACKYWKYFRTVVPTHWRVECYGEPANQLRSTQAPRDYNAQGSMQ